MTCLFFWLVGVWMVTIAQGKEDTHTSRIRTRERDLSSEPQVPLRFQNLEACTETETTKTTIATTISSNSDVIATQPPTVTTGSAPLQFPLPLSIVATTTTSNSISSSSNNKNVTNDLCTRAILIEQVPYSTSFQTSLEESPGMSGGNQTCRAFFQEDGRVKWWKLQGTGQCLELKVIQPEFGSFTGVHAGWDCDDLTCVSQGDSQGFQFFATQGEQYTIVVGAMNSLLLGEFAMSLEVSDNEPNSTLKCIFLCSISFVSTS
jgi:hypothetical protein